MANPAPGSTDASAPAPSAPPALPDAAAPVRARRHRLRVTAPDAARVATFAALLCALSLAPAVPVGFLPVPVTLQTLGVMLAGALLGPWFGTLAVVTYLVLALAGLPVLAGGAGGVAPFVGPTAGYLYGFVLGAAVTGALVGLARGRLRPWQALGATFTGGVLAVYAVGIPGVALVTGLPLRTVVASSWVFLPGDVLKAVLAAALVLAVLRAYPAAARARR